MSASPPRSRLASLPRTANPSEAMFRNTTLERIVLTSRLKHFFRSLGLIRPPRATASTGPATSTAEPGRLGSAREGSDAQDTRFDAATLTEESHTHATSRRLTVPAWPAACTPREPQAPSILGPRR